jgi:hypothetical protein
MAEAIRHLPIGTVLSEATNDLRSNPKSMRLFWIVNFVFLAVYKQIDQGLSNPWSILWLIGYYVYWCVFFRVYYHKRPYFGSSAILNSMAPSTKMLLMTVLVAFLLVILPYLPLLMGFNDKYLQFFEHYMEALQNMEADVLNQAIFAVILLFLSPMIICRPFVAWISALQGLNGSMHKAFYKTRGNYLRFVELMFWLNLPCVAVIPIDSALGTFGWFNVGFYSIYFLWFNLVFARMYDFFSS